MTVGTQMQQAIAGIQSASATMKTFALETEDKNAKQQFQQIASQLDCSLETLKQRQQYIEEQEPQYKQQ
jgi:dihydroorotase